MSKTDPTTILILAANPADTTRLRLDEEVREIEDGLLRARRREEFIIAPKWAVRVRDLRQAMLNTNPQIVHFSGHGTEEGLAFADASGQAQLVSTKALSGLFELFKDRVKCVVLNACYSAAQATEISRHIDYVVGMKKEIGDRASIEFAVGFYDALLAGRSIEDAYKFGCNAIEMAGIPEALTPVLHKRAAESAGPPPPSTQPSIRPAASSKAAVEIFYSYSHGDQKLRGELDKHLAILRRQGLIRGWHDRQIEAGSEWANQIDERLNAADIILLLVSADFLASDYCYSVEMERALQRHEAGEARVIPIILRPCDWTNAPFSKLQALPRDTKPVTAWPSRDEAFLNVAKGIRAVVEAMLKA